MFAKSYVPTKVPELIKDWSEMLKKNDLPYIPENILEAEGYREPMMQSCQIFTD